MKFIILAVLTTIAIFNTPSAKSTFDNNFNQCMHYHYNTELGVREVASYLGTKQLYENCIVKYKSQIANEHITGIINTLDGNKVVNAKFKDHTGMDDESCVIDHGGFSEPNL